MKRELMQIITLWLVFFAVSVPLKASGSVDVTDGAGEPRMQECLLRQQLDYKDDDKFTRELSHLAAEKMHSGGNQDLFCFEHFLNKISTEPLTLKQYKQVLFLQAEVDLRIGKFDSAHRRYMELKLIIRDEADPLLHDIGKKLTTTADKIKVERKRRSLKGKLQLFEQEKGKFFGRFIVILLLLIAISCLFIKWNRHKYAKFKKSSTFLAAPIENKTEKELENEIDPVELEKMRRHDGRVSKRVLADYKENGLQPNANGEVDERTAMACLLVAGHKMINRLNNLAPYPLAVLSKIPILNKVHYFWQYTLIGFAAIILKAAVSSKYINGYNLDERLPGLFLVAALIVSSLTCLRLMANVTISSLDEVISMLEVSGKKFCEGIPQSVLRIEKNFDFLFRSPWQLFVVLVFFLIIIGRKVLASNGDQLADIVITLAYALLILLIACPIIWMLIGSAYVLSDICNMDDLAMNPLSPLKTMGLEKLTAVIGTFGISSSFVLSFGCSIPVITGFLKDGHGNWFWFIMIMPLLFFYWIYPYFKITGMVKQQKAARMQILKVKILHIFNDWVHFEQNQLEGETLGQGQASGGKKDSSLGALGTTRDTQKIYFEMMNNYYEIFKKIDESPQSYINFGSILELGKALGIPSAFAILSALIL